MGAAEDNEPIAPVNVQHIEIEDWGDPDGHWFAYGTWGHVDKDKFATELTEWLCRHTILSPSEEIEAAQVEYRYVIMEERNGDMWYRWCSGPRPVIAEDYNAKPATMWRQS